MSLAYRGLEVLAERRWTDLARGLGDPGAPLAYERRVGRVAGGVVGTVGGLVVFAGALGAMGPIHHDPLAGDAGYRHSSYLVVALLGSGVAALAAYFLARSAARAHLARLLERPFVPSGDAVADVVSLETDAPGRILRNLAGGLEHQSILLPMLAISLLAPLTLHALVAGLLGDLGSFDTWIRGSAMLVGHAHLVLCICCARFAAIVRTSSADTLRSRKDRDWWRALGFTTFASAIPGVVLMAVPPMLTLLTGLVFIPAMFKTIQSHVLSERAALAVLG